MYNNIRKLLDIGNKNICPINRRFLVKILKSISFLLAYKNNASMLG